MASGHKKRKAALIRSVVLTPANSLTNVSEADRGSTTNQNNLMNVAIYSKAGNTPTFTQGKQALLSDAISNADGVFTAGGLTGGETSDATTLGLTANSRHYMFATPSNTTIDLSSSNQPKASTDDSVIVYSCEGPQSSYVPYYLGGAAKTAKIRFGTELTASGLANISFTVFGKAPSGDKLQIVKADGTTLFAAAAGGTGGNAEIVFDGNNFAYNAASQIKVAKTAINGAGEKGFNLVYSSSANTSTTLFPGIAVVIKPSS